MTLNVTHAFVSGVADDPTAAAAGEVLPSHWNANHVLTGAGGGPSIDTAILYDKAGVIGEDANLEWDYTNLCLKLGGASHTDANGNVTLSIKGPTNTDQISLTDGTNTFGFFVANNTQLGSVSNTPFGFFYGNGAAVFALNNSTSATLNFGAALGWATGISGAFAAASIAIGKQTDGILEIARPNSLTSATGLQVYNTTDTFPGTPTNYERGVFDWTTTSNVLTVGTQFGGSGVLRGMQFVIGNVAAFDFGVTQAGTFTVVNYFRTQSHAELGSESLLVNAVNGKIYAWNNAVIGWSSSGFVTSAQTPDTGFARVAASVVEINNGTKGTGPGVILPIPTTFANLPASPTQGMMASITDGLAGNCGDGSCTTFGTNVTGGTGALKLNLWYNGTHWTLIGK